ncbi:acetyl-CoA carboxylase biotin carboxyl carrier protein [Desulfacinum infernum DSM 9756]|jgi:biotin carboxyl carrier protein|uniref:Acetyl-CoA carboxylase biotin carboxyl carrier protein n=1 Tax=Desulfacinum infernum DSM 9756 TaxID=1121391 RepID=A0A1M4XC80_9BACT|nr:biotin/lipoyl-containing protein [Desulfacinum infernum]MBC7357823.1 biotin/lipoyl-binding protein [Desulfacinum sp.]MBZ4660150.1 putative biotin/lipoyl attachment protein [Desulfacinum sp.]SHE91149.1 acetyl-CoA carboxylase biotin carboxyl carrier protein [Desulfacinum infernum DSM 9756]
MAEELLAPMVGKILKIKVKPGDAVKEDDEIMVMESMKLETGIHAPCDGVVKEIKVAEGDRVEEDDLLAIIE